jgi:predicted transposase/invertase (TIGR01784 family)
MVAEIQFTETDDPIDIRYDNVFKAVFTRNTPASRGALSDLVSALIGKTVHVTTITANEPPADDVRDRNIRFDIACKAETGEPLNIEMSLNPDPYEPIRLEYYAGKLFTGQELKGIDKNYEDLKETYQIAILAKGRFFTDEVFQHTFQYYDAVRGIPLEGRSRVITVELSKVEAVADKPVPELTDGERWAVYFRYLTDRSKRGTINKILKCEGGIAMASEVLMTISRDEVERARLTSEFKYEMDHQSKMVTARREGEWIGRQKGLLETAKNLKALNVPVDTISLSTGLSPEEIAKL